MTSPAIPSDRDGAARHLHRVLASLATRLDGQVLGLLAADRFAAGREVLARFAGPGQVGPGQEGAPGPVGSGQVGPGQVGPGQVGPGQVGEALAVELADALEPAEAVWLAEQLLSRWAAIGSPQLDPIAWIEGPIESDPGQEVHLVARAEGLEPGWTVQWNGAVPADSDATAAMWTVPSSPAGPAPPEVTARLMGRGPDGRVILIANWRPSPPAPAGP